MTGTVVRRLPAVDPTGVPDTYVEGISSIEDRGDTVRVTFYVDQDTGGQGENWVAARLLFSKSSWEKIIGDLQAGKCSAAESQSACAPSVMN